MRLTIIFSDLPDIDSKSTAKIKSSVTIPDEVVHLIGVEQRVREIGQQVDVLSSACVHLHCQELGIINELMNYKQVTRNHLLSPKNRWIIGLYFKTYRNSETLRIIAPHDPQKVGVPDHFLRFRKHYRGKRRSRKSKPKVRLASNLVRLNDSWCKTESQRQYHDAIQSITEQMEILLNVVPNPRAPHIHWHFDGFHPFWNDSTIAKALNKESLRLQNLEKKPSSLKKKPKAHGKGNRPGAIPGKFKGVQFRSQLEIRFATEMEARGVEWIYEEERLGEGNYLVDFHLPDFNMWVEVKGKFEARDHFLLKDVAETLLERDESLYVFTSGSPMKVTPDDFTKIKRKEFWKLFEN